MSSSPGWVEAASQRGRAPQHAPEGGQLLRVGGQRRGGELEVAEAQGVGRAQVAQMRLVLARLGEGDRKLPQEVADQRAEPPPRGVRPARDPAVDERQIDTARARLEQQIGPELGLHHEPERWSPVRQKAAHGRRQVDRQVLVNDALGQTLGHQPGRGHGPRGHQQVEPGPALPDALDERQRRERFADAGAVDPDQRTRRPRHAGMAEALGQARRILPAPGHALVQMAPHHGRRGRAEKAVSDENSTCHHAGRHRGCGQVSVWSRSLAGLVKTSLTVGSRIPRGAAHVPLPCNDSKVPAMI